MRYFSWSAQNGRLYLHYVGGAFIHRTAEDVEAMFNPLRDRRIKTVEELDATLRESVGLSLPLGLLHLTEGMEEEARRRSRFAP